MIEYRSIEIYNFFLKDVICEVHGFDISIVSLIFVK
jgi:hypothetical protein